MTEEIITKLLDLGFSGLLLLVAWKLLDRWAAKFLEAQQTQAAAMSDQATSISSLANVVKEGHEEQREVLIAVRVLSTEVRETKQGVKELDGFLRQGKEVKQ